MIDKKYIFMAFLVVTGLLALAELPMIECQSSTVVLLCEIELKCEGKKLNQYLLND